MNPRHACLIAAMCLQVLVALTLAGCGGSSQISSPSQPASPSEFLYA